MYPSEDEMQDWFRRHGWSVDLADVRHRLGYRVWCLIARRGEHRIIVRGAGLYRIWLYAWRLGQKVECDG